jgi:hypothetical protein
VAVGSGWMRFWEEGRERIWEMEFGGVEDEVWDGGHVLVIVGGCVGTCFRWSGI